jgi:hypothetical protein
MTVCFFRNAYLNLWEFRDQVAPAVAPACADRSQLLSKHVFQRLESLCTQTSLTSDIELQIFRLPT